MINLNNKQQLKLTCNTIGKFEVEVDEDGGDS